MGRIQRQGMTRKVLNSTHIDMTHLYMNAPAVRDCQVCALHPGLEISIIIFFWQTVVGYTQTKN